MTGQVRGRTGDWGTLNHPPRPSGFLVLTEGIGSLEGTKETGVRDRAPSTTSEAGVRDSGVY